ncbi:uncharacterized protein J8A68_000869 [[Candida] subhashii]|uniref:Nibrin second BRCT domain-containing protein n=1 Tax=[Candida] subhashii TaxID=561895 RepID=A0A8J5QSL5_9ASCO|nr:uncharacterized protein J8A68_000869 [[Candida] subhashii]KAG7665663.1 hypothetical protein J8A68_000869 [[Candida] subhashii]
MWIVKHKGDPLGGRDTDADFSFQSPKASRHQIELITGPSSTPITQLKIRILSRAKTKINQTLYKLEKDSPGPLEYDFSTTANIIIESISNNGEDTPIEIHWHPFNLFPGQASSILDAIGDMIDIRIVDDVRQATHYYTNKELDDAGFRLAVMMGLPLVNNKWFQTIMDHPGDVGRWLVDLEAGRYLPGGDEMLLPRKERRRLFDGVGVFVIGKRVEWLEMGVEVDEKNGGVKGQIREMMGDKEEFIVVGKKSIDGIDVVSEDDIWNAVKMCSVKGLKINTKQQLNPPPARAALPAPILPEPSIPAKRSISPEESTIAPAATTTRPGTRKRRRYEKVDKLHFFSLATPTSDADSINNTDSAPKQAQEEEKSQSVEISPEVEETPTPAVVSEDTNSATAEIEETVANREPSPILEPIAPESEPEEIENVISSKKRRPPVEEIEEERKPTKIPKFMPKVSLVDAIKQTRAKSIKNINEELGITEESEQVDEKELQENLSNLAIVEVIDITIRPKRISPITEDVNEKYKGRKNFKKFHKNISIKSNFARSYVPLETVSVDNEVELKSAGGGGHNVAAEFDSFMGQVKGFAPEEPMLFVQEESDSETEEQSVFRNEPPRSRPNAYEQRNNDNDVEVDDDDDEEEDDQPRFRFSRQRR